MCRHLIKYCLLDIYMDAFIKVGVFKQSNMRYFVVGSGYNEFDCNGD
jgi:hypothetical protein